MTVTASEKISVWVREHGFPADFSPLYAAFPEMKRETIRKAVSRLKNGQNIKINNRPMAVTAPSQAVTPVTASHTNDQNLPTAITRDLVEFWIITGDDRAELAMKFLQYRDKMSVDDTHSDEEAHEFHQLMAEALGSAEEVEIDEFSNNEE